MRSFGEWAYQIYVVERAEKGSQYRRISVEFTIHNAYKKELAQLSATPVQTLENSSTNEIEKIQNNTEEISKTEVSDVDTNIPVTKKNNEDTYVLIRPIRYLQIFDIHIGNNLHDSLDDSFALHEMILSYRQVHQRKDLPRIEGVKPFLELRQLAGCIDSTY